MKHKALLLIIILIGAFFRFYRLSSVPPSLSHDEVAIGYNAYSILKTGRDEYGVRFPLLFRSFDDYKLPGMVYITIPTILIFGLNELGVRFPAALLGLLSVVVFFFLVKELFDKESRADNLHIFATFLFSVSIWHVNFSRQLFESTGSLFFLLLGLYFLIRFLKNPKSIIYSALSFGISLYFYYSVRIIIPVILIVFGIIYHKEIKKHLTYIFSALIIGFVAIAPLMPSLVSSGGLARINIVSVTNDEEYISRKDQFTDVLSKDFSAAKRILYNRRLALADTISENFLKNLSPDYLFINGTGKSSGLLYMFELPLIIIGFYMLCIVKSKSKWIILAWFFTTTIVGGLSTRQPNALRTLPNAPLLSILSGLGCISILHSIEKYKHKKVLIKIGVCIVAFCITRFLYLYFDFAPRTNALAFGDGYKQMVYYVKKNETKYDNIYITGTYWRPYIYVLFWSQYDPATYQNMVLGKKASHYGFDKYVFGTSKWDPPGGYRFSESTFNPREFVVPEKEEKTLFIMAREDMKIQEFNTNIITSIDGMYEKNAFYATYSKPVVINKKPSSR